MSGSEREAGKRRLAVALEYDGSGAPRVTAKGAGEVAQKILDLAEQHGVPLQENRELVEMLTQMPLESEIPEQLYRVVAEVIAFAYLVRGKLPAGFDGSDP
jgi:flagellar biosynthesis protein